MAYYIHWRLMFRVKDERKARGRIEKVRQALELDVEVVQCEPYWKIAGLWVCLLKTPLLEKPVADTVLDCLTLAGRLANGWYVLGTTVNDGVLTFFDGVFDAKRGSTPYIAGFEWGWFNVRSETSEPPQAAEPGPS